MLTKNLVPDQKITKETLLKIIYSSENPAGYCGFISAMEKIYSNENILLSNEKKGTKAWLSNGVSLWDMFPRYITQINKDLTNHSYYKFYDFPSGSPYAREALAIFENQKFNKDVYTKNDFCLTEGATGAISALFETFKSIFPDGEIIIPSPSYYLFRFIAQKRKIHFREISTFLEQNSTEPSLLSTKEIIDNISEKTKMIILSQPTNPSGEIYSALQIEQLLKIAKEKNIWILFDEVFFDLIYNPKETSQSDLIAYNKNTLENIIIIKSYSKNRNMPALRLGYIFSKIEKLISSVGTIVETQVGVAVGSNFQEVIILDSFYSTVNFRTKEKPVKPVQEIIKEVKEIYQINIPTFQKNDNDLLEGFLEFSQYTNNTINFYKNNFTEIKNTIELDLGNCIISKSGFNSFVNIHKLDKLNSFDFTVNLYLSTGIMIQPGTYFGFSQSKWDNEFGFWFRVTYGTDIAILKNNLSRLKEFIDEYINYPDRYIHTNLVF